MQIKTQKWEDPYREMNDMFCSLIVQYQKRK